MDRRGLFALGLASAAAAAAPARAQDALAVREMDIWPSGPPGAGKVTAVQSVLERSTDPARHDRALVHITHPTMTVYRPANPDGSAVLIMPGGGYQRVVVDKEGEETARRLAAKGITAAVLVYRLPGDGWAAGLDAPLQDAQRALRLLRSGAAGPLDAKRIGVLGFSAGGHLAAAMATRGDAATYPPIDAADRLVARPDFACLAYAAVLLRAEIPGLDPKAPRPPLYDLVSKATPPCFIVHAADDPTVPVDTSLRMFSALRATGIPAEMHVFQEGGHGFGVRMAAGKPAEAWPDLFMRWGGRAGFFTQVGAA